MTTVIAPELLALQRLYAWESEAPTRVALTQPMGDGSVRDFTWGELAGEVRRMGSPWASGPATRSPSSRRTAPGG